MLAAIPTHDAFMEALGQAMMARGEAWNAATPAVFSHPHGIPVHRPLEHWPTSARRGWRPLAIGFGAFGVELEWACGASDPARPFHDSESLSLRLAPLNRLFPVRTAITPSALAVLEADALPLAGLVFHMSRCGSTLLAQALKAWPGVRVISEPSLLDSAILLAASGHDPAWLAFRTALAALAQPAAGRTKMIIKLDAWHALLAAELVQRTGVPWLFVHRDPHEVLVSHAREAGRNTVANSLPEAWLQPVSVDDEPLSTIDHAARAVGSFCRAILPIAQPQHLLAYEDLSPAGVQRLAERFGLDAAAVDRQRLDAAFVADAKHPSRQFSDDQAEKRAAITPAIRSAAQRWIEPHHSALRTIAARGLPANSTQPHE